MNWSHDRFEKLITDDQSPTLKWLTHIQTESMHGHRGAFSETQYIYGDVLKRGFKNGLRRVLSLGLGLGYNELMVAGESLKLGLQPDEVYAVTYEIDSELRERFVSWLLSDGEKQIHSAEDQQWFALYDEILAFYTKPEATKKWLLQAYQQNQKNPFKGWCLKGELSLSALKEDSLTDDERLQIVLFDAYSSKTTPELWNEQFLGVFLHKVCDQSRCLFTTYACTGVLKVALRGHGFTLEKRKGFLWKKDSTLAVKPMGFGLNTDAESDV